MAIAFVEGLSEVTSANFILPTTAFNCVAGNLILFGARYSWDFVHTISAVTDTAGNTYTKILTSGTVSNIDHQEIWYAWNSVANASNQITVAIGGGTASNIFFGHLQYSGILSTSDPLDTNANASSASATNVTTGSFTTAQADELCILVGTVNAVNDTISATVNSVSATIRAQDTTTHTLTFFESIFSSVQTGITANYASNNTRAMIAQLVTFKGATSAVAAMPRVPTLLSLHVG